MNNCLVDDCIKPTKRAGYCYGHYMKNWRYGTPTPEWPAKWVDIRGHRYGTLTVTERLGLQWLCMCDCGQHRATSAGELNREGDANTCGTKRNHLAADVDYSAAHSRVHAYRGPAAAQPCIDCGRTARHWSYDHNDPDERISQAEHTKGIAFILDIHHYQPRCVPCHKRFDLRHINSTLNFGLHALCA
jgi:hypothetical protein